MKNHKISVIMPVYNGMPYLKEAIASILKQTYKNFELIIVNDASKDSTLKYLNSLKDKRIKIINNKKNIGLAKSLNIALKKAKGEYIARMDADDISLPNRLKHQLAFLEKNSAIDLCGTWADIIDENNKIIGEKKYPSTPEKVKKALSLYTAIIHPTFMGRKKLFLQLNGYNPKYDFAEDYDFLMRSRKNFKLTNIPKKLFLWRYQNNRRSRTVMNKMYRIDLAIKKNSLKKDGFDALLVFGIIKMLLVNTLIPQSLKLKIAILLKIS